MKAIDGSAGNLVAAPLPECFALLADVEAYPAWAGELVAGVDVLDRDHDGAAVLVLLRLYVRQSPVAKRFEQRAAVDARPPGTVGLHRVPRDAGDRERLDLVWSLSRAAGTRVELSFHAETSLLPSFVPLFGVGDDIAEHLVALLRAGLSPARP